MFQKPLAWEIVGGEEATPSPKENILGLLPMPVQIEHREIILVVIDYETWKKMVLTKQEEGGLENE